MAVKFDQRVKEAEEALQKRREARFKAHKPTYGGIPAGEFADAIKALRDLVNDRDKALRDDVREELDAIEKRNPRDLIIKTETGDKLGELNGLRHMQLELLLKAVGIRGRDGRRKNIALTGGAGGGKSTAGKQVAEALGLSFDYIGQTEMPHDVVGSNNPVTNEYRDTALVRAAVNGGVVMLEEMDSWSPRATLVTNPFLANGYISLPNGEFVERHPDCVVIACMNTWGTGATTEYVGRNKLDAAYLDRFGIKLHWQYDPQLERAAAGDDRVVDCVQKARFNANQYGVKTIISPRSSIDVADMVRGGFSLKEACNLNFLASLDKEQRKMVSEGILW